MKSAAYWRVRAEAARREWERERRVKRVERRRLARTEAEAERAEQFVTLAAAALPVPRIAVAHLEYEGARAIYVAWPTDDVFVKIGVTKHIAERLMEVQVGNPRRLRLLAAFHEGDGGWTEDYLHARFVEYRAEGEWFRLEGEVATWLQPAIDDLRAGGPATQMPSPSAPFDGREVRGG